jgi:hypothetical protein
MGWTVDVEFKPSPIEGIGTFALKPIPRGTKVWTFDASMRVCDLPDLAALSPERLRFALHGGYYHQPSDRFVWYEDGMHLVNHAFAPRANIGITEWTALEDDNCTALRDIAAGEELLEDYSFWSVHGLDPGHWLHRLYRDFCPEHFDFLAELEARRVAA